jgi:Arc/MetJ-type ribon-helix-helix transcriptional regulator
MESTWMVEMAGKPVPRTRIGDTEKLTINLGVVDLGQIDLLVDEGFYSNRTDLIRTAVRNQLAAHGETLKRCVTRRSLVLGLRHLGREELEQMRSDGRTIDLRVVGLARIDAAVSASLARATIRSVTVLGAFQASAAVRKALADRIT